ncbi:MAG: hypothetical protein R3D43_07650 [Tepidamorphaceae bacterium]|nr:hypothetical protein [Rhodobiaceae bacterium]
MFSRFAAILAIGCGVALMAVYGPTLGTSRGEQPAIDGMKSVGESGPLDGMKFVGELGPEGKPKDVTDVFVFAQGDFVSEECRARCNYPARPYLIRETDAGTEFLSNTKCPTKNAEITWHGTVKDGRIKGIATWTVRRWYWTMTNTFEFAGKLEKGSNNLAIAD